MHLLPAIRLLARRGHRIAAWALVAGVAGQMLMATTGLFVVLGARGVVFHASVGRLLALLPLIVLGTALAGRLGRRDVLVAAGVVALAAVQVGLVLLAREGVPIALALHPLNGGALLATAAYAAGSADRGDAVEPALGHAARPIPGSTTASA